MSLSRGSTSLLRSIPLTRPAAVPLRNARGILGGPSPSREKRAGAGAGNTTSIDYRILSGVEGFLPQGNFDRITEWQAGLWSRLQDEVRNNPALVETKQKWDKYGLDMTDLISSTARDSQLTLAYNYAALLLNNSYFLEGLNAEAPKRVPEEFRELQEKVEGYAEGMVGGGWLWIVRAGDSQHDLDVIPTFGSGTLLVSNRAQRGRIDQAIFSQPPTSGSDSESEAASDSSAIETAGSGSVPAAAPLNAASSRRRLPNSRSDKLSYPAPIAVLNLFEHAYIGEKYGVWAKREYARDWWSSLDWTKVSKRNASVV